MSTVPDDLMACRVLVEMLRDRDAGQLKTLQEYQDRYPRHSDLVVREWTRAFSDMVPDDDLDEEATGQLHPGDEFAGMRIKRLIGRGGQGEVYLASDEQLDRLVAIKILLPLASLSRPARERLLREGRLAARLDHDSICSVLSSGVDRDLPYLVFEHVDGTPLQALVRGAAVGKGSIANMDVNRRVKIVAAVADAMAYAHGEGIVHRDLKPNNIHIVGNDQPIILDLGLGRMLHETQEQITESGVILGTLGYMAPERLDPGSAAEDSPALDVYSLGVLLHQIVAPQDPVCGPRDGHGASLSAAIPKGLQPVVSACLQRQPRDRYPSALELSEALHAWLEGRPVEGTAAYRLARLRHFALRVLPLVLLLVVAILLAQAWFLKDESGGGGGADSVAARLQPIIASLDSGDLPAAAAAVEASTFPADTAAGQMVRAAWMTERQSLDPGNAERVVSGQDEAPRFSVLGPVTVQPERVPGRSGQDIIILCPGAARREQRLTYEDSTVHAVALSNDALRIAVAATATVSQAHTLDVWSVVDGALLLRCPLEQGAITALAPSSTEAWFVGYETGHVECWQNGIRRMRRQVLGGPVKKLESASGNGVLASDGTVVSWCDVFTRSGAAVIPLKVPVRTIQSVDAVSATVITDGGWAVRIPLTPGGIYSISHVGPNSPQAPVIPQEWGDLLSKGVTGLALLDPFTAICAYEDQLHIVDRSAPKTPAVIRCSSKVRCLRTDADRRVLVVGLERGEVLIFGLEEPPTVPPLPESEGWLATAAARGFVSRPLSVAALPCVSFSGGAGAVSLGKSGIVPGLPDAWYAYLEAQNEDALKVDPLDHGAAVRLATASMRRGRTERAAELLSSPPLVASPAPTVSLLRSLHASARDENTAAREHLARAEQILEQGGGLAGPMFTWLQAEAAAAVSASDARIWELVVSAIRQGLNDPSTWEASRAALESVSDEATWLTDQLGLYRAAARLLLAELHGPLAASEANKGLHKASAAIVSLLDALLGAKGPDDLTFLKALAMVRQGEADPRKFESVTSRPLDGDLRSHRANLLILARVRWHLDDQEGAANAYNKALTAPDGGNALRLACRLLAWEMRQLLVR